MAVEVDAAANVVGRYQGRSPGLPALLLGSHIDTVRDAGYYDGNLGVVAAIAAVAALNEGGERLPFAIEVMAFGDEEGVRFPGKLTGSRAIAGTFDPQSLEVTDQEGIHPEAALRGFGGDPPPSLASPAGATRCSAMSSVHIEQGPVLEPMELPVGLVTAIAGASRFRIEWSVRPAMPEPCRWELRQDALVRRGRDDPGGRAPGPGPASRTGRDGRALEVCPVPQRHRGRGRASRSTSVPR